MRPATAAALRLVALAALLAGLAPGAQAQELNCNVSVNYSALQGTEFQFLSTLRDDIARYLNDRAWTDDVFDDRERIDCSFQVVFRSNIGLSRFTAQLVVGASRPIYGTAQRTNVLLLQDDAWEFEYNRGQSLVYNPNVFNPFVSVIDYYAHLILGYDYDSFAELGGTRHFERARAIAELARSQPGIPGWNDPANDRTRGALVQQILDPRFEPLRRASFAYHFGVLDAFAAEPDAAWARALELLASLRDLYDDLGRTRTYATDVFYGAKHQELIALLADAPQRAEAYSLLVEMDSPRQNAYGALVGAGGSR